MTKTIQKDIFDNRITLRFRDKILERKYKVKSISEKNILLYCFLVFLISIINYLLNLQVKEKQENFLEENLINKTNIDALSINVENKTISKNIYQAQITIVQSKNIQTFSFFNFGFFSIMLFFQLILVIFHFFQKTTKNLKNSNKFNRQDKDTKIEKHNFGDETKNQSKISNENNQKVKFNREMNEFQNNSTNEIKSLKKYEKIYGKFLKYRQVIYKIIIFYSLVNGFFQFSLLKYFIKNLYKSFQLHECTLYFHSLSIFLNIFFINSQIIMNFLSISLGIFISHALIKSDIYSEEDNGLQLNIFLKLLSLLIIIFVFCVLDFMIDFKEKMLFFIKNNMKLNLKKTVNILENLNTGFVSFDDEMNLNYNKKFSKIFTTLLNEIFGSDKKHENTINLLKCLKLDDHLDTTVKNKSTIKYFDEDKNEGNKVSKSKKSSLSNFINENKKNPTLKKNKKISNENFSSNADHYKNSTVNLDFNSNELLNFKEDDEISSDIILLLLFFDKDSIILDNDLDIEIQNYIQKNIYVNFEADEIIIDIVNANFMEFYKYIMHQKNSRKFDPVEKDKDFSNISLIENTKEKKYSK